MAASPTWNGACAPVGQVGSVSGANNPQGINIAPQFATGQHVRAIARLCNDPSPPSQEQIVQAPALPLPTPTSEPIFAGDALTLCEVVSSNITTTTDKGQIRLTEATAARVKTAKGEVRVYDSKLLSEKPLAFSLRNPGTADQLIADLFVEGYHGGKAVFDPEGLYASKVEAGVGWLDRS